MSRLVPGLLILGLIAAISGCWEEIHYTPSPETAHLNNEADAPAPPEILAEQPRDAILPSVPPVESPVSVTAETEPALAESQPEAPAVAVAKTPPAAIQNDDLFGGETAPPPAALTAEDPILPTPPETSARIPALGPREAAPPRETEPAPEARPPSTIAPAITPQQRELVWQAASKWSYAEALFAKAVDPRYYEPIRAEAVDAAAQLNVELPPLPADAEGAAREAAVIALLREEGAGSVAARMHQQLGQEAAALAELAIRSQLLLLVYSPKIDEAAQWAVEIRAAAEATELPVELWQPLVTQLEQQDKYATVKATVFDLHRRVAQHLQEAAEEAPAQP